MLGAMVKRCRSFLSSHDRASKFMDVDYFIKDVFWRRLDRVARSNSLVHHSGGSAGRQSCGSRPPRSRFQSDIRPIFSDISRGCHGPDDNKRKAGLRWILRIRLQTDQIRRSPNYPGPTRRTGGVAQARGLRPMTTAMAPE